jgi:hypothetical protein
MVGKITLTLACLAGLIGAVVLLRFGTLNPCGILRVQVREEGTREGTFAAGLATILPDVALDAMMQAAYGPLTPGRCLGLLFNRDQQQRAPSPASAQTPFRPNTSAQVPQQGEGRYVGSSCYMGECFHQYILEAAHGADAVITVRVRNKMYNARQPQVPLGQSITTFRALCRIPGGYIEYEPSQRVAEPNPQPSHATEGADRVWTAVCSQPTR